MTPHTWPRSYPPVGRALLLIVGLGFAGTALAQPKPAATSPASSPSSPAGSARPTGTTAPKPASPSGTTAPKAGPPAGSASASPSPAGAASPYDEEPSPYDEIAEAQATAKARELYRQGVAASKQEDWPAAYAAFVAAWKLKKSPSIAFNLGRAEVAVGRYRDAVGHLVYVIQKADPVTDGAADAREWLEIARRKAAKLLVVVDLPGARVLVDGTFAGKAPLSEPLLIDPGPHFIEARLGSQHAARDIVAKTGTLVTVDLHVPPPVAASGPVKDGPSPLPPADTFFTTRNVVLLTGLGATLAGLTVGTVTGIVALQQRAYDVGHCTQFRDDIALPCYSQGEANRLTLSYVSFGGFAEAGIFALAMLAYWRWGAPTPAPAAPSATKTVLRVLPTISSTAAGVTLTGAF